MNTAENLSVEELEALLAKRKKEQREQEEAERKAYEELKTDTVISLVSIAKDLNDRLKEFKVHSFETLNAIQEMVQQYARRSEVQKGNFTLEVDNLKIKFQRQDKGFFDERADQAEKHIIDFVNNHFSGDADTRDLIMSLLERKEGHLDIDLVQKLYKYEHRFDNENWRLGIKLLKESYQTSHSKDYIRFYERDHNGAWQPISLQFSAV